ncbi:NUDIX hydrolase [Thalassoroseus pseudoceratinae]|uniref:NUDIX hydrolase n=1 Tax=Thalassoroseus pseudoceratinae TaxID=2713176 RepID=UPI001421FC92|nr:NUDIX hydrolase [Thalassoroseus pseudoceratinae]
MNSDSAIDFQAHGKYLRLLRESGWEYVDRVGVTGIVAMIPVTDDGKIVLIEQFRAPVGKRVVEIPAGLVGDQPGSETPALAAKRELLEETGYKARRMKKVTEGPPSAGLSTEVVTFYLATGLTKVEDGGGDGSEDIEIHEVPLDDIDNWLKRRAKGRYIDPKVYTGLYFAKTVN